MQQEIHTKSNYTLIIAFFIHAFFLQVSLAQTPINTVEDAPSPWGIGWISRADGALSPDIWENTDVQLLSPLLTNIMPEGLSYSGRSLIRRLLLSGTLPPDGKMDQALLLVARQLALIRFGERTAAHELDRFTYDTIQDPDFAMDIDKADWYMATGQTNDACRILQDSEHNSHYWLRLRSVCFALAGDYSAAEFALEVARSVGMKDQWHTDAINALGAGGYASLPPAEYKSGMHLRLSLHGRFPLQADIVDGLNPSLARLIAQDDQYPSWVRVHAADMAISYALISDIIRFDAYFAWIQDMPAQADRPFARAIKAQFDMEMGVLDKISAYKGAVLSKDIPYVERLSSARLLAASINEIEKSRYTFPQALNLAHILLLAGDTTGAIAWREFAETLPELDPESAISAMQPLTPLDLVPVAPSDAENILTDDSIIKDDTFSNNIPIKLTSAFENENEGQIADMDSSDLMQENIAKENTLDNGRLHAHSAAAKAWLDALISLNLDPTDIDPAGQFVEAYQILSQNVEQDQRRAIIRLFILSRAMGASLTRAQRHFIAQWVSEANTDITDSPMRLQMQIAENAGAVGEVALLAAILAGNELENTNILTLESTVHSLTEIGLKADARAFAMEAIANYTLDIPNPAQEVVLFDSRMNVDDFEDQASDLLSVPSENLLEEALDITDSNAVQ